MITETVSHYDDGSGFAFKLTHAVSGYFRLVGPDDSEISLDYTEAVSLYRALRLMLAELREVQIRDGEDAVIPCVCGVSRPESSVGEAAKVEFHRHSDPRAVPIREALLSARIAYVLTRHGIEKIGDLVGRTEAELLRMDNFGRVSLDELKRYLVSLGLRSAAQRGGALISEDRQRDAE